MGKKLPIYIILSVFISYATLNQVFAIFEIKSTEAVKVTWSSLNVVTGSCTATFNGFNGLWTESGSQTFPANTFTPGSYPATMSCTGAPGSNYAGQVVSYSETLIVKPAAVKIAFGESGNNPLYTASALSFTADRVYVPQRSSLTLSWNYDTEQGGTCTASNSLSKTNWTGTKSGSGQKTITNPGVYDGGDEEVTYSISCSAPGETTRPGSVTVLFEGYTCGGSTGQICN